MCVWVCVCTHSCAIFVRRSIDTMQSIAKIVPNLCWVLWGHSIDIQL